jgi:DNA adenine methylase
MNYSASYHTAALPIFLDPDLVPRFRSPLRYPGGKQRAVGQIHRFFPAKVREFREPLVGGGSVYLHARSMRLAQQYWINDLFEELISFWQCVQDPQNCLRLRKDLEDLRSGFKSADAIKNYFLKVRVKLPESEYEKALLFFFFNRCTFSGTTRAGGFSKEAALNRFTASSIERLGLMPQALAGTQITNLDYQDVIETPGSGVFLYLDPPYYRSSRLYGKGGELHQFDHERLAISLRNTEHEFLLSYDDCPEIRWLYRWARIVPINVLYGMGSCRQNRRSKMAAEVLISNGERNDE